MNATKRTGLWIRRAEPAVDFAPTDATTCSHGNCREPATYIAGWQNPPHHRHRWASRPLCPKHAKYWYKRNAHQIDAEQYPPPV